MNRRKFLRRTSAVGALGLAGCTGAGNPQDGGDGSDGGDGGAGGDNTTPSDTPTETQTPPPTVTDYDIRTLDSRCQSGDETVSINKGDSTVTISGVLTASNPCHEAMLNAVSYTGDSDTLRVNVGVESTDEVCVDCVGAIEYEATVEFADGLPASVTVSHQGEIIEPGDGDSGTASGSDAPTLVESSLEVAGVSNSASETTADVSFDEAESKVFVTGTIEGNNGCKTARLGRVKYNHSDDRLSVDVETVDRENAGTCTQQLVYIDYAATIEFEGGIPGSASVSHNGNGVVSAGYDSASASAPDDQS